ncbi:DUF4190 domain-containing protein [Rugosimonospora africana]|uniref:DUF4190 domain-containing protein n=1 Tax=Rugosimonospora africana TaxID=556532 RepID=A0A8J3QK95_9ACTN|nr:hypothetical protein Raf01_07000 [Rugosimonospora africana]
MTWPPPEGDQNPGQPVYGQPYGPDGYPGQYRQDTTNIMAILALIFAFVFAPAGIVLGHFARRQIRLTGERGSRLAMAGLVLGYVFTAIGLLLCCGLLALLISASRDSGTR